MVGRIVKKDEIAENSIVMTKMIHADANKSFFPHWHNAFEIIRAMDGSILALLNGEKIQLECGDAVLVCPGCIHDIGLNRVATAVQILQFQLPESMASGLGADSSLNVLLYPTYTGARQYLIRHEEKNSGQVAFLCDELYRMDCEFEQMSDDVVRGAVQMLLGYFSGGSRGLLYHRAGQQNFDMLKVCAYIDRRPLSQISLAEVSTYMGYSPNYFSVKFREVTGIGFRQYIDQLKMQEARRLLGEGRSATEIATILGYSCVQNFSRSFKRIHQVTLKETLRNQK